MVCSPSSATRNPRVRLRSSATITWKTTPRLLGSPLRKLLSYQGLWGAGEECAYETLNFADGKRNAQQIRDAVSAEYGPVPLEMVVEYLKALEKIGVVSQSH